MLLPGTGVMFCSLLSGRPPTTLEHSRCWPSAWLARDCPDARLLSLEYAAPASGWEVGGASGLVGRASQQMHSAHCVKLVTAPARLVTCDSRWCSAFGQPCQCFCRLHGLALVPLDVQVAGLPLLQSRQLDLGSRCRPSRCPSAVLWGSWSIDLYQRAWGSALLCL